MGIETANIHEHDTADVNGTGVSIDSKSTDVRQWKITNNKMRHWDFFDTFHCQGQSHCRSFTSSLRSHMCGAACASSIAHILYIASQSVRYGEAKTWVCSTNGHIRHSNAPRLSREAQRERGGKWQFQFEWIWNIPTCNYTRGKYIRLKFEAWKLLCKSN